MDGFAELLEALQSQNFPPVEKWRSASARDMDLRIDTAGNWFYQGSEFSRQNLVSLLSRVMIREGNDYFLVSPGEKLRIEVEDVPFIVVDFEYGMMDGQQTLAVDTNVGIKARVNHERPLRMRPYGPEQVAVPYVEVRPGLDARFSRSCYYRLTELCEARMTPQGEKIGLMSGGEFHALNVEA